MDKFVAVVECAIEQHNKFLVIKRPVGGHAAGTFAFPGGKVEYSDGKENKDILLHSIQREIFEEVGLKLIDPIRYVTSCHFVDSAGIPVLYVLFHCKLDKTPATLNVSLREVPEYHWLTQEEIHQHPLSPPWFKQYVQML